jgi:hypothetical protein
MKAPPFLVGIGRWHIRATFPTKVATWFLSEEQTVIGKKPRTVATTLYVPIPVSFADDPPASHARPSYCREKVSISDDNCRFA